MVNVDKLLGLMKEKNINVKQAADACGMSDTTFYRRLKERSFGSQEIEVLVKLLGITDPIAIFFTNIVA